MKIGYVRVSSNEQITDRQFKLLVDSCDRIMAETISAKDIQRPVYQSTIDLLNQMAHSKKFIEPLFRFSQTLVIFGFLTN